MKIRLEGASKEFIRQGRGSNVLVAVAEANLELEEGKVTALSGPSGSGKSTLLNMMAGLLPPTKGKVLLDDKDLYSLDDSELSKIRNKHIGIIPQGQSALQALTVLENVMVPYILYNKAAGKEYEEVKKRAEELLALAGMEELKNVMPSELSGGELRRMAVCRSMVLKPELIMADEPTGDLDEENTEIVMKLLKGNAENGSTVLVVTHDSQVYEYADKVLEMRKGIISDTAEKS